MGSKAGLLPKNSLLDSCSDGLILLDRKVLVRLPLMDGENAEEIDNCNNRAIILLILISNGFDGLMD